MPEPAIDASAPAIVSIFAVIVLYKMEPHDSTSFKTLQVAAHHVSTGKLRLRILLYDNTPGGHCVGPLPEGVRYESASHNAGLPAAYNRALEIAAAEGFDWLLTLDQDTSLPECFLSSLCEIAAEISLNDSIAAIVPQITDSGRIISPSWWLWNSIPRAFPLGFSGIPQQASSAFNSASTIRISALRIIGGYDPRFWLDNSDSYLYRKLQQHRKKIYVAGDIRVEHQFSVLDMNQRVSLARYRNILAAGCAFWDLELGTIAGLDYTARLLYRTFYKHWKRGHDPAFRRASLEMLKKRLFHSRGRRIADWEKDAEKRFSLSSSGHDATEMNVRRRISVCMAAYNGERYIAAQLQSILDQLADGDEVVVVDDASRDKTVVIVESFCDKRIRIIRNPSNRGVVGTFERAVLEAKGDIIFLSDQDDLWKPNKVSRLMQAFDDPAITLALSDAKIIDAEGKDIERSYFHTRGGFVPGVMQNILRNHYIGCTMAFRREILAYCLPFPTRLPMHDMWIGIVNDLFGKTAYINEQLVDYRQHDQNVSRKGNLVQRVQWRLNLLGNLIQLRLRTALGHVTL